MADYTQLTPSELATEVQAHLDEVLRDYSVINERQLNWTVHPDRWSIGQCLDHLVVMDRRYLDRLVPAVAGARARRRLGTGPYPGSAFGRWFTRQVGPMATPKTAPAQVAPSQSEGVPADVADRFMRNERDLLALLEDARVDDMHRVLIGSPIDRVFRVRGID
jgi:hypothetical protein